jgi:hypothetical protein
VRQMLDGVEHNGIPLAATQPASEHAA